MVQRALASHQCSPGSMPARDNCCPNFTSIHSRCRQMCITIPKPTCCFSDGRNGKRRFLGVQYLPYQRMGTQHGEFPWSVYVQNEATVMIRFRVGRRNSGRSLIPDKYLLNYCEFPSRGKHSNKQTNKRTKKQTKMARAWEKKHRLPVGMHDQQTRCDYDRFSRLFIDLLPQ